MPSPRLLRSGRIAIVAVFVIAAVVVPVLGTIVMAVMRDDLGASDAESVDLAVVGDSLIEQSHDALLTMADDRGLEISVYAFGGTALCGWMEQLEELAQAPPRMLVLSFVGNVFQTCINPTCETECQSLDPAVSASRYREDLEEVIQLFQGSPTQIYVVSPPPIAMAELGQYTAAMQEMYRAAGRDHPDLRVIESATRLDPDGQGFQATLPCLPDEDCPPTGEIAVREDDGAHLTPAGGRRYALAIFDALEL